MVNIGLGWSHLLHATDVPPVLAQVAYGFGWGSLMGIALVVCGVALYLLRTTRPNLARDHDIFFAAVALLCGGILFFQGWRLDPILQFGQFLMTGSAVFFAVESIRLRGIVTQQAKRNSPIVDEEREVSPDYGDYEYEAEYEELEPYEPYPPTRRIPGSRDTSRRSPRDTYGYEDEPRRPPTATSRRPSSGRRPPGGAAPGSAPPRKPRSRPNASRKSQVDLKYSNWNDTGDTYDAPYRETPPSRPSRRPPSRPGEPPAARKGRPSQPRPSRPTTQVEARLDDDYSDFYSDSEPTTPTRPPTKDEPEVTNGYGESYETGDRPPTRPAKGKPPTRPQPPVADLDDPFPDDEDEDYGDRYSPNPYDDELEEDNSNQFDR